MVVGSSSRQQAGLDAAACSGFPSLLLWGGEGVNTNSTHKRRRTKESGARCSEAASCEPWRRRRQHTTSRTNISRWLTPSGSGTVSHSRRARGQEYSHSCGYCCRYPAGTACSGTGNDPGDRAPDGPWPATGWPYNHAEHWCSSHGRRLSPTADAGVWVRPEQRERPHPVETQVRGTGPAVREGCTRTSPFLQDVLPIGSPTPFPLDQWCMPVSNPLQPLG